MKLRYPNLETLLKEADLYIPAKETKTPPRIGISANRKEGLSCIAETYVQSVLAAGGSPVVIPVMTDISALTALVSDLDGLLMSGGGDINPLYVNEEPTPKLQDVDTFRDEFDLLLIRLASNRQIPMMGICRGHQIINVAFGGSIYQDIHSQNDHPLLKHSQQMPREQVSHTVTINNAFDISGIENGKLPVNSFHHQAIKEIAPEFIETAVAPDGINEAIKHTEKEIFSVQWHPEALTADGDQLMLNLFRHFIAAARRFSRAKAIHNRIVTLDSHTDTPMIFPGTFDIGEKEGGKVNLPFMEEGRIDATFMVAYIPQGKRDEQSLSQATNYAKERLGQVIRQATLHPDRMGIALNEADIRRLKAEGRKAILLGVENGYAIGKQPDNIRMFKEMGVCYITLCHNGDNDICDSARGNAEWNGLSPFGKEVVHKMNEAGVMIDISHASDQTVRDVLALSTSPIIASHSSARALCNHPRNLPDELLKAIADKGGVIQICLYKGFINEEAEQASLSDALRHIEHIIQVAGIDHVGIGSDFDGDGELIGCRATNELINITTRLLKSGYTEEEIEKIWGGNFLRVMTTVQSLANK